MAPQSSPLVSFQRRISWLKAYREKAKVGSVLCSMFAILLMAEPIILIGGTTLRTGRESRNKILGVLGPVPAFPLPPGALYIKSQIAPPGPNLMGSVPHSAQHLSMCQLLPAGRRTRD